MKLTKLHESIRAVYVTPSITLGSAACDKLFGNATVIPRAHNVGTYIVATFPYVFLCFLLELQTLLKCHLISQLWHTDSRSGHLSLLWGAPPPKQQFLLGYTAVKADASGAVEHGYVLSSEAETGATVAT